jgi:multidrug efflux pump subunit AcrA (membrane-fusion protein)
MTAARLLWSALGLLATVAIYWQASRAGWIHAPQGPATSARSRADSAPTQPKRDRVIADGRLVAYQGAEVVIATEVAGKIIRLPVREKSIVHRGDLLAALLSDDLRESRD